MEQVCKRSEKQTLEGRHAWVEGMAGGRYVQVEKGPLIRKAEGQLTRLQGIFVQTGPGFKKKE